MLHPLCFFKLLMTTAVVSLLEKEFMILVLYHLPKRVWGWNKKRVFVMLLPHTMGKKSSLSREILVILCAYKAHKVPLELLFKVGNLIFISTFMNFMKVWHWDQGIFFFWLVKFAQWFWSGNHFGDVWFFLQECLLMYFNGQIETTHHRSEVMESSMIFLALEARKTSKMIMTTTSYFEYCCCCHRIIMTFNDLLLKQLKKFQFVYVLLVPKGSARLQPFSFGVARLLVCHNRKSRHFDGNGQHDLFVTVNMSV